jgi:hypothetical protein
MWGLIVVLHCRSNDPAAPCWQKLVARNLAKWRRHPLHEATATGRILNPSMVLLLLALMIQRKEWYVDALSILRRPTNRSA